jgi:hypothetical protein
MNFEPLKARKPVPVTFGQRCCFWQYLPVSRLAESIFRAVQEQTPFSPADFFSNVESHSGGGPEAERLRTCLDPLLKTALPQSSRDFVRWVPRVARFSFYTAKVAGLAI